MKVREFVNYYDDMFIIFDTKKEDFVYDGDGLSYRNDAEVQKQLSDYKIEKIELSGLNLTIYAKK